MIFSLLVVLFSFSPSLACSFQGCACPPREICDSEQGRQLHPGQTVWTRGGSEGRVQGFFPDGRVSVRVGRQNFSLVRSDLATRGCFEGLCSGDRVVTRGGSEGVVNGVFPTQRLSVKIGYMNFTVHYVDLAPLLRH